MAKAPPASQPEQRRAWLRDIWDKRSGSEAQKYRAALQTWYGEEAAKKVKYAEAFEICEYGRRPDRKELLKLFPIGN